MASRISSVGTRPQSDHEVYSDCMQIARNLAYAESIYGRCPADKKLHARRSLLTYGFWQTGV